MPDLASPHDRFFRGLLSRQEAASQFVRHYLPEALVACLDPSTLEITQDSFVDEELRSHLSDLVYRVDLRSGQPAFLYLLFEHKSTPSPAVAFQLLRYVVRLWDQQVRQGQGFPLPPVVPVVFYHGRQRWRVATEFGALVNCPKDLTRYVPQFQFALCDLSTYADEQIRGEAVLRASLLVLKHIFDDDLAERLPGVLRLFADVLGEPTALGALQALLRYVSTAGETVAATDIEKAVRDALQGTQGDLMSTAAQQWIEQGLQQGIQQGIQQGLQEGMLTTARSAVIDALEARFDVVPLSILAPLEGLGDAVALKALLRKAVTVGSLEEFKAILLRALA